MRSRIRTAIIGYGRSGRLLHAAGIRGNPEAFEVVAIASRSTGSLDQARNDFGCPTYPDYRQMLRECAADLVVIVTRNDQHRAMACDVLDAGCHALVTKPLGINADEVAAIYNAADRAGKKVFPFLPARWGTDYRRIREIVASGEIGRVFAIHRSVCGFATRDDWQTQSRFGGGIVLNWGAHLIDPPLLVADSAPRHLFGSCQQVLNPGDAEDVFYSVITTESGVRVHSEWSYAPQSRPTWFVQGAGGCIVARDRQIEVSTGTPAHPDDPTNLRDMQDPGSQRRTETVGEHLYGDPVEIYRDVADDLRRERPYPVSQDDATRLTTLLDAVKRSHDQQTLVTFS